MNMKLFGSALAVLAIGSLASCSSDVEKTGDDTQGLLKMELAAAPQVNVWSGHTTFFGGETRAEEEVAEVPNAKYLSDEVEVNLSINDVHMKDDDTQKYDVDDLVSKLSIHVRSAKDVKVTLPVSKDYYCDQDDLYIFNKHEELFAHGGSIENNVSEISFKVGEGENVVGEVSLKITFGEENIVVETSGVTEEVLAYCREKYGDGMNFEILNYYNRSNMPVVDEKGNIVGGELRESYAEWTLSDLKENLDKATVEFTEGAPDYYINAFTGNINDHDGQREYRDCYVTPADAEAFEAPYYNYHYNGFDQNVVYKNVDAEVIEGEEDLVKVAADDNRFGQGKAPAAPVEE